MEQIVCKDYAELSERAAEIIAGMVDADPEAVLGLATGSTPIGCYEALVRAHCEKGLSFASVTTFNLDEYRGIDGGHEQSYRHFMNHHLFDAVDIDAANTHVPDGSDADAERVCTEYERAIEDADGIDLQLLGLGHNGHIGFNEPTDVFERHTHLVDLSERTIEANSRLFDSIDDVPRQAYTMGIGTIMAARSILVVVSGADKAEICAEAFYGPVTPKVPASILQFHPCVTVIADEAAAAVLPRRDA